MKIRDFHVKLDSEMHEKLTLYAINHNTTKSRIVRDIIKMFLKG